MDEITVYDRCKAAFRELVSLHVNGADFRIKIKLDGVDTTQGHRKLSELSEIFDIINEKYTSSILSVTSLGSISGIADIDIRTLLDDLMCRYALLLRMHHVRFEDYRVLVKDIGFLSKNTVLEKATSSNYVIANEANVVNALDATQAANLQYYCLILLFSLFINYGKNVINEITNTEGITNEKQQK